MSETSNLMESFGTPSVFIRVGRSFLRFMRQMAQNPLAFISMLIVGLFIVVAVIGPSIAPYEFDETQRAEDRSAIKNSPPTPDFIMGTDNLGRDTFSRILWGARDTIGLPTVATAFAVLFGTIIGLTSGYLGGWVDEVLSRIMDSLLAIPALVLALVMITTIVPILNAADSSIIDTFGANNISLTVVIVILYVPIVTRVVRSATLNVRDSGYIEAAKLRGESAIYIMFREILPSVLPSLVVEASLRLSYAIFLIASLGFLGLGFQPPSPEWGSMVFVARDKAEIAPWAMFYPIAAIGILIISINLMSDGLRRVLRNEAERE